MKSIIIIFLTTFTFISKAQSLQELNLLKYPLIEQMHSEAIKDIENKLFGLNPNFDNLTTQLEGIIADIPSEYSNSFENKDNKYNKFWDKEEYEKYKEVTKAPVIRLQNVYPYACYLLSVIKIKRGLLNDALSILELGLKLESDQPSLLNQLGHLYSNFGTSHKDTSSINYSNKLFKIAFSSREYNTDSQKARSLRGIGYNLIELNDYENSKFFYEKSLEFKESKIARSEIKLINEKLSQKSTNIYTKGSNLDKSENVYSFEYYTEQKNKLPLKVKEKIPNKYTYLWSKASLYLAKGSENFRKDDYFNYPLKEWDIDQIDAGVFQIVQFLKGITPEYNIEISNIVNAEQLLLTFHFEKQKVKKVKENIFEITFRHKMTDEEIILYFKLRKK
jgi:hypothetical protein